MKSRRVAFITGAGRGIGRGSALALARDGFDIVGNDLAYDAHDRAAGLAEVEDRAHEFGVDFVPAPGDIADLETHAGLLRTALQRFGRVDVLV